MGCLYIPKIFSSQDLIGNTPDQPTSSESSSYSVDWTAVTDFGRLVITTRTEMGRAKIIKIGYFFSEGWTCGATNHLGLIVDASRYLINDNMFTVASLFPPLGEVTMHLNGVYDEVNHTFSGTWEEVSGNTVCSGTWEATR
jgi:hypothetical protein